MDKWLGETMTIRDVGRNGYYRMREDMNEKVDGWLWNKACIAGLVESADVGASATEKLDGVGPEVPG